MFLLPVAMREHAILLRRHAPQAARESAPVLPVLSGRDQVTARRVGGNSNGVILSFSDC
jgi:hypothetical protein